MGSVKKDAASVLQCANAKQCVPIFYDGEVDTSVVTLCFLSRDDFNCSFLAGFRMHGAATAKTSCTA